MTHEHEDPDLPICGRVLVGRGYSDTHDPVCVRIPGHGGLCNGARGEDADWDRRCLEAGSPFHEERQVRPKLLDLFCCEGGAAMGYHRAGFDVVGVDNEPQPRYPFRFIKADALEYLDAMPANDSMGYYAAIHASPPCQAYSNAQRLRGNKHPDLIAATRERLIQQGVPYVIENVPGARSELRDPVELCGTMFGLALYRHRLFECSFPVTAPLHGQHYLRQVKMGRPPTPDEIHQPVGHFSGVERARRDMGMPWADRNGLREAIPPAYTEHVGHYLMAELNAKAAA